MKNRNILVALALSTPLLWPVSRAAGPPLNQLPSLRSLTPPKVQNDYRGTIEFLWEVQAAANWSKERWSATVDASGVQCTGASDDMSQGQLTHVDLRGPGLFHITFDPARGQYTFEVACPSATHPAESSWTDTNSSYKQRGKEGETVKGSWDTPSDVDPINGQTGRKVMSWNLCYKCQ
jgi:hypothetical protein